MNPIDRVYFSQAPTEVSAVHSQQEFRERFAALSEEDQQNEQVSLDAVVLFG